MADLYRQGFLDGIIAYAWHKDGRQWVGATGRTLAQAKERVEETWNYSPPADPKDARIEELEWEVERLEGELRANVGKNRILNAGDWQPMPIKEADRG